MKGLATPAFRSHIVKMAQRRAPSMKAGGIYRELVPLRNVLLLA